jgi:DNA-binding Lrp family transcriptional regulator
MTTTEIAQAVGKTEQSILNWVKKMLDPKFLELHPNLLDVSNSISLKAGNKDPHHPADYTQEETLAIIEAGMGADAAGIFRANAATSLQRPPQVPGAYLRELRLAYDKALISRDDWRRLAGLTLIPEDDKKHIPLLADRSKVDKRKCMTIRELMSLFGCSRETIKRYIRELFPEILHNGVTTYLTESQIRLISKNMRLKGGVGSEVDLQNRLPFVGIETDPSRKKKIVEQAETRA